MTKLEMAIFIADTLFGKHLSNDPSVTADNWKVKDLMKATKVTLIGYTILAESVRRGTRNAEVLA